MTTGADRLDRSTILGFVAMALAVLVVANDFTSLSVALPALERDFGVGVNKVQWVINGYALVFGVLIVTGGRLADMFGRRQMFLLGAGIFAFFSVIGGLAAASGMGLLPMMGVFALTSFIAGPMYERIGPKIMVSLGAAFLACGMFLLSRVAATTTFDGLVPGMVVLGIGVGLFYSSITTAAVTAIDASRSSLASGIVYMFQVAGGAVGLGVNTAIAHTTPALVDGIGRAFAVDALLATVGLAIALLFIGNRVVAVKLVAAE